MTTLTDRPIISADSHITEPPETYVDYIDKAYLDRAPRMVDHGADGDVFVIDGFKRPINIGTAAAAGKPPDQIRAKGDHFKDLHRGGWDPTARLADQARDGVAAGQVGQWISKARPTFNLRRPYTRALRLSLQRHQRLGVPAGIKTGDLAR